MEFIRELKEVSAREWLEALALAIGFSGVFIAMLLIA